MTQFLPPNLLALFAARDPLPFLPPVDKLPHEKQHAPFTGISAFLSKFEVSGCILYLTFCNTYNKY